MGKKKSGKKGKAKDKGGEGADDAAKRLGLTPKNPLRCTRQCTKLRSRLCHHRRARARGGEDHRRAAV